MSAGVSIVGAVLFTFTCFTFARFASLNYLAFLADAGIHGTLSVAPRRFGISGLRESGEARGLFFVVFARIIDERLKERRPLFDENGVVYVGVIPFLLNPALLEGEH